MSGFIQGFQFQKAFKMGSTNSHMQQPQMLDHQLGPPIMHEPSTYQPQYPDMNQIFKGIPKMMQVADDMHRMTNYIQDLRNMMFFCSLLSFLGLMFFLAFRFIQNRKSTKRRRRAHNNRTDDSEQSSLSISRPSQNYRHYHSARPVDNWTHKIEMDRMLDSTSTRQTNMTHHGANAGPAAIHPTGSHPLLLNNKLALLGSPEHQLHQPTPHSLQTHNAPFQSSPLHEPNGGGAHSNQISPCPTPTSSGQPATAASIHTPHHQPNGQLKRLDPVKLVVDEMPYMEESEGHEEHC